jgi:hypothetical protein
MPRSTLQQASQELTVAISGTRRHRPEIMDSKPR